MTSSTPTAHPSKRCWVRLLLPLILMLCLCGATLGDGADKTETPRAAARPALGLPELLNRMKQIKAQSIQSLQRDPAYVGLTEKKARVEQQLARSDADTDRSELIRQKLEIGKDIGAMEQRDLDANPDYASTAKLIEIARADEQKAKAAIVEANEAAKAKQKSAARPAKASPASIYANCDDVFSMYLNGQEILSGEGSEVQIANNVALRPSDRIVVKVGNTGAEKGLTCVIQFAQTRRFIRSSVANWSTYTPKNDMKWADLNGIDNIRKATLGSNQTWRTNLSKACGVEAQAVWGDADAETSYLIIDISKAVMEDY